MGGDSTGGRRVGVREVRLFVACLVAVAASAVALAYALAARVSIPLGVLAAVEDAPGSSPTTAVVFVAFVGFAALITVFKGSQVPEAESWMCC